MKIEFKNRKNLTRFKDIMLGDMFALDNGELYVKMCPIETEKFSPSRSSIVKTMVNAVSIRNGQSVRFDDEQLFRKVMAIEVEVEE